MILIHSRQTLKHFDPITFQFITIINFQYLREICNYCGLSIVSNMNFIKHLSEFEFESIKLPLIICLMLLLKLKIKTVESDDWKIQVRTNTVKKFRSF